MIRELVARSRSYRRFKESREIDEKTLRDLVELARLSPSAMNLQPLKFMLSWEAERNARIFPHLRWAGYLTNWDGPAEGERPSAYIVVLGDTEIRPSFGCDHGIAVQSILLGAVEQGLGGCMFGSVDREGLRAEFGIPERFEILLVVALGEPTERVVVEDAGPGDGIKYWRDDVEIHHVPKRSLDELVIDFDA